MWRRDWNGPRTQHVRAGAIRLLIAQGSTPARTVRATIILGTSTGWRNLKFRLICSHLLLKICLSLSPGWDKVSANKENLLTYNSVSLCQEILTARLQRILISWFLDREPTNVPRPGISAIQTVSRQKLIAQTFASVVQYIFCSGNFLESYMGR